MKKRAREPLTFEIADSGEPRSIVQKLDEQFNFNVTSDNLTRFMEGEISMNKERSTTWAIKIFNDWRKVQNGTFTIDLCPEIYLLMQTAASIFIGSVNSYQK